MILVVLGHIILFGYQQSETMQLESNSYNTLFMLFRMPLFFFLSGFILYKTDCIWTNKNIFQFIKKKFKVQIIPTAFFMVLFNYLFKFNQLTSLFDLYKSGYWFTLTLFEFFLLYIFCICCFKIISLSQRAQNIFLLSFAIIVLLLSPYPVHTSAGNKSRSSRLMRN